MAERGGARVATRRPRALWFEVTPQRLAIRQHSRVEALPQRPQARFSDLLKDLRSTSRERGCRARAAAEGEGDHMRCRGSYAQRTSSWVEPVPKTLSKPNLVASAPDTFARAQQRHAWGAEFWVLLWVAPSSLRYSSEVSSTVKSSAAPASSPMLGFTRA